MASDDLKRMQSILSGIESLLVSNNLKSKYILDISELKKALPKTGIKYAEAAKISGGVKISATEYAFDEPYGPEKLARKLLTQSRELRKKSGQSTLATDREYTKAGLKMASGGISSRQYLNESSMQRASDTIEELKRANNEELQEAGLILERIIQEDRQKLSLSNTRQITAKNGKATYTLELISNNVKLTNLGDIKGLRDKVAGTLTDYAKDNTIQSLQDIIADAAKEAFEGKRPPPRNKRKTTAEKTTVTKTTKVKATVPKTPMNKLTVSNTGALKRDNKYESSVNILIYLNSIVKHYIKQAMGRPEHLQYRSGRFARSVMLVGLTGTREQAIHIAYKYMLYPYQTFERGWKQGFRGLDPRPLIQQGIRTMMRTALHNGSPITFTRIE